MEPQEHLGRVADELFKLSEGKRIWLFYGDLGSGKTTLIKNLCQQLGIPDLVQSPTFSLVNEYPFPDETSGSVYHFDLYRIKSNRELHDIGIEEYLDSGNFCFIEWPAIGESFWPDNSFRLILRRNDQGERIVSPWFGNPIKIPIQ